MFGSDVESFLCEPLMRRIFEQVVLEWDRAHGWRAKGFHATVLYPTPEAERTWPWHRTWGTAVVHLIRHWEQEQGK